ncbi:MAG: alpha/beta hydrolase [Bacteroidota bacterium]
MLKTIQSKIAGRHGKPITFDITYLVNEQPKPVVVFAHGFKGFKDWGHWSMIGEAFARKGYVFLKFNYAFNGTTPEKPLDFADLEAFGNNNFSKELDDVDTIIDWLFDNSLDEFGKECDLGKLTMIGHSRSGPITIVKSSEDTRIGCAVTWASVHSLAYAWKTEAFVQEWEKEGVYFVLNGRTGQQMPLYFQLYKDYQKNHERFDIEHKLKTFDKPMLVVHGKADPGVPLAASEMLHSWNPKSQLVILEGADHVFGGRHPFTGKSLPDHSAELVEVTTKYLENRW